MEICFKTLKYQQRFTEMCNLLVLAEYPDAIPIEGKGGDSGIDSFTGKILGKKRIFQYKYFHEKIGTPQKKQIVGSLETAAKLNPDHWTLLIPVNFNTSNQIWFEGLQAKYSSQIEKIDYWPEDKLKSLLLKHPTIREQFFPSTDLRIKRMERLLSDKGQLPKNPSSVLLNEVQEIRDLINIDNPFFRYELQTDRDKTIISAHPKYEMTDMPTPEFKIIFEFPKDKTGKKASKELENAIKRGKPATIKAKYIKDISPSFYDLLPFREEGALSELKISSAKYDKSLPVGLKVTGANSQTSSIDYVELKKVRAGTDEIEFSNIGQKAPIVIRLLLNLKKKKIQFNYKTEYEGFRPETVLKFAEFFKIASLEGSYIEIKDLQSSFTIVTIPIPKSSSPEQPKEWFDLLEHLIFIENAMNIQLKIPKDITQNDYIALNELDNIINTGKVVRPASNLNLGLSREGAKKILSIYQKDEWSPLSIAYEDVEVELFGISIPLGNCFVMVPEARIIQSIEDLSSVIENSPIDGNIKIDFEPKDHKVVFEYQNWCKKELL